MPLPLWTRAALVAAAVCVAGCSSSSSPSGSHEAGTMDDGAAGGADATMPAEGGSDANGGAPDAGSDGSSDGETISASDAGDAPSEASGEASAPIDCSNDEAGAGDGLPNDLVCTGLYSDWATKTVASQNVHFTPGYVLWSDDANKNRWVYFPPGTQIDTTDMDNWVFPVGTRVWKEFSLGPQRVETRILAKMASGWVWATYRWTADGESGATRLDSGELNVNGTSYEIPAHNQCKLCHGGRPDFLLGLDVINLGASTARGLSLQTLIANNMFTTNPPTALEIPEDSTGHARASLGWLHSNCGVACHNRNPSALASNTGLVLKTSGVQLIAGGGTVTTQQLDPWVTAVDVAPGMQTFAQEGFYRIAPGHPELSLIPTLDGARSPNAANIPQMPPIITHIADTNDVTALKTWILSMPIPDSGTTEGGTVEGGTSDGGAPDGGAPDGSGD